MDKKNKIISIVAFSVVLIAGFLINGILSHSGFESVYTDALMSRYSIAGETAKNRIESSLNMGKKLYFMDEQTSALFSEIMRESTEIEHIYITDASDKIINSTRTVLNQEKIPFKYYEGETPVPNGENLSYSYKFLDSWFLCIPLFESKVNYSGTLYMEVAQDTISDLAFIYIRTLIKLSLIIFVIGFFIYYVFLQVLPSRKSELILTVCLVLFSQGSFSVYTTAMYKNAITDLFNQNLIILSSSIKESLESPARFADGYDNLTGISDYLNQRLVRNVDCSSIYITNQDMDVMYSAQEDGNVPETINRLQSGLIISSLKDADVGMCNLVLKVNHSRINEILRDMILDSFVVVVVAIIFALIFKDIFAIMGNRKDLLINPANMDSEQTSTSLRLIKVSTFIFMFAAYVTLSFVPMYIEYIFNLGKNNLPEFLTSMASDTIITIPVSTYMLGITVSMFVTLFVLKKLTIRRRYIIMSSIFVAGTVLTISSYSFILLTIARFIAGFGFGGILLSTSSLVIEYTSDSSRSAGFGTNASALASASIASIPVGGVIVNKFGYQMGFIIAIVFAVAFLLFAFIFVPVEKNYELAESEDENKSVTLKDFFHVLFSRHVIVYVLCVNIPFQFVYWGLFSFLLPLYMSDTLQLSQSNIGLILSIFSVVSLFAALAGKMADKIKNDKLLIGLGAAVCGGAFLIFGSVIGGLIMFIIAMVCMGIDNLFIDSIEEVYLEAGEIKGVSEENVLQSYKVMEKVLSVFVPTLTGMIIASLGFSKSFFVIGGYSLIGGLGFVLFGRNARWLKKPRTVSSEPVNQEGKDNE